MTKGKYINFVCRKGTSKMDQKKTFVLVRLKVKTNIRQEEKWTYQNSRQ